jgi:hypothetical protein
MSPLAFASLRFLEDKTSGTIQVWKARKCEVLAAVTISLDGFTWVAAFFADGKLGERKFFDGRIGRNARSAALGYVVEELIRRQTKGGAS